MRYLYALLIASLFSTAIVAEEQDVRLLAEKLHLYGGQKATVQWERVFSSQRHLKRYKLDKLPLQTRMKLKHYLIEHAADSDQPVVPGL
jgi:isocitrate dehydrogenase